MTYIVSSGALNSTHSLTHYTSKGESESFVILVVVQHMFTFFLLTLIISYRSNRSILSLIHGRVIPPKRWFRSSIHSLRRWNDESRSAGIIYVIILTHIEALRLTHIN